MLVIRCGFTLIGSIIEPLVLQHWWVVADRLDDLDRAEGDPQPPQGRELVIGDLGHMTMSQLRVVPCLQGNGKHHAEGKIMGVFVAGATGALGRHLVPMLVAAGHEVTATTRTPGKVAQLGEAGAEPVIVDGLDREAVTAAVRAAGPEVIVHQMTALAGVRSLRKPDQAFAATNDLRTRGTDNLLAAAARVGTRRVIAQGNSSVYERSGGPVRTEEEMTEWRGSSNEKARKELGWEPRYASWREGFRAWVSG